MKYTGRLLLVLVIAVLIIACIRLAQGPRDRLFHGKPESQWINEIQYGIGLSDAQNQEQIKLWRDFGPEGLRVLERALRDNPGLTYRKIYRRHASKLPGVVVRRLPAPQAPTTRGRRMNVVDLLSDMGTNSWPAWPAVAQALADEDSGVRQLAISFFTWPENDAALLNHLRPNNKKRLLPLFLRALEDTGDDWAAEQRRQCTRILSRARPGGGACAFKNAG